MRTVTIYALIDPRDNIVKYVGKTVQKDPSKRYDQHIFQWKREKGRHNKLNSWIKCLANLNLKPTQIILETCDESNWKDFERKYIAYYKELGINLKNQTEGGDEPSKNCNSPEAKKKRLETLKNSTIWKESRIRQAESLRKRHLEKGHKPRSESRVKSQRAFYERKKNHNTI